MTKGEQRIADAIAELGVDSEPPAGWNQRVLDAADYAERVKRVVRDACATAPGWVKFRISDTDIEAIARRVAEQLAAPGPVLSAKEREAIGDLRKYISAATGWSSYPSPSDAAADMPVIARWVAALDRLLGATR